MHRFIVLLRTALVAILLPKALSCASDLQNYFPLEFQRVDMAAASVGGSGVYDVAFDRNGAVWVATPRGLARFDHGTWELFRSGVTALVDNNLTQIYPSSDGSVWVTTERGVARIRNSKIEDAGLQVKGNPRALTEDRTGGIWAAIRTTDATEQSVLAHFVELRGWTRVNLTTANGTFTESITTLYENTSGAMWIGTLNGVYQVDATGHASRVPELKELADLWVTSMATAKDGSVWIGTRGHSGTSQEEAGGLWHLDKGRLQHFLHETSRLPSNNIEKVVPDQDGTIWVVANQSEVWTGLTLLTITTPGEINGLVHIGDDWEVLTPENSGLSGRPITSIRPTLDGMWVGTDLGLLRGSRSHWRVLNVLSKPGEELVGGSGWSCGFR